MKKQIYAIIALTVLFLIAAAFFTYPRFPTKFFIFAPLVIIAPLLCYPLTSFNQDFLHTTFKAPFVMAINIINKIFGTKIKSAQLIIVGADKIPIVDFGYRENGVYVGKKYYPLTIATYLLKYLNEKDTAGIKNTADWLVSNYTATGNFVLWSMDFPLPYYNMEKGWVSAFAQARILKALYNMGEFSRKKKYFYLMNRGLKAFFVDLEKGGLKIKGNKGLWFEECAQKKKNLAHILNGHVFCLLDLHYLYVKTKNKKIKALFDKGIQELKAQLANYDSGNWTFYDRIGSPARYDYHQIHVEQMKQLYDITKDRKFLAFANRWENYRKVDMRFLLANVLIFDAIVTLSYYFLL